MRIPNTNATYGDTIGITIYQPEDVIDFIDGTIHYGNHAHAAQYWYAVGIEEVEDLIEDIKIALHEA